MPWLISKGVILNLRQLIAMSRIVVPNTSWTLRFEMSNAKSYDVLCKNNSDLMDLADEVIRVINDNGGITINAGVREN